MVVRLYSEVLYLASWTANKKVISPGAYSSLMNPMNNVLQEEQVRYLSVSLLVNDVSSMYLYIKF